MVCPVGLSPKRCHGTKTRAVRWKIVTRVLVVDDDVDINEALQQALRMSGYDAVGVTTGAGALEETARLCPDLVLLDQMLPDIDGVEICRRLRSAPETRRIPIVFVTARADEKARVNGLALGADDYVVKPFSLASCCCASGPCCAGPRRSICGCRPNGCGCGISSGSGPAMPICTSRAASGATAWSFRATP
jgi:CheY-like chemotaxis protein